MSVLITVYRLDFKDIIFVQNITVKLYMIKNVVSLKFKYYKND